MINKVCQSQSTRLGTQQRIKPPTSVKTQPSTRPYAVWRRMAAAWRRSSSRDRYVERCRRASADGCSRLSGRSSVKVEAAEPLGALMFIQRRIFLLLANQKTISDHEAVDLGRHETAVGVFDRVDDRLAAHVERGVHNHAAAGPLAEFSKHAVHKRIALAIDG